MLLHPLKDPVPSPPADLGRTILGLLDEVSHAEALDLVCRTRFAVLLAARPRLEGSSKFQDCFNTLCQYAPTSGLKAYLPHFKAEGSGHTTAVRAAVLAEVGAADEYFKPFPGPVQRLKAARPGQKRCGLSQIQQVYDEKGGWPWEERSCSVL